MDVELAVIGAGPAGLAAAVTAAEAGVDVALVDEQGAPGGQIWRQPPAGMTAPPALETPMAGQQLLARAAAAPGLRRLERTLAWGHFADGDLGVLQDGVANRLKAARIIVATGAYDLPVAFPGWTLPGVMAAGGVQAFLKSQLLLPGRRPLLVGAHPLLLIVAAQLVAAGAELAGVAFAQRPDPRFLGRHGRDVWRQRHLWPEGWAALRTLRRAGVPIWFGRMIKEAVGTTAVTGAVLTDVDENWHPVPGTEIPVATDLIAVGYGFVPSTEFTRQAGCRHLWDETAQQWVCAQDEHMRSSESHILVAGEVAGIGGADVARLEGQLAGLTVAADLGYLSSGATAEARAPLQARRERLRAAAAALNRLSAPRPGLFSLIQDQTIICRCEELTAGHLRQSLADHPHLTHLNALKLVTRCGMGPCQGRYCQGSAAHLLAQARGFSLAEAGQFTARMPVKPLPLGALAAAHAASQLTRPG